MRRFLIVVPLCLYSFIVLSQENLNSDPAKFNFNLSVDDNWRLVTLEDFEAQNPKGLHTLKNPALMCLRGYVHKDSVSIMNPPSIIFQLLKMDGPAFTLADIKAEADSILRDPAKHQDLRKEMTKEAADIWSKSLSEGTTYFDRELNGLVMVVKLPGRYGIDNIMYTVTYFGKDYVANLKLIYLDNNQTEILPSFLNMARRAGFTEIAELK